MPYHPSVKKKIVRDKEGHYRPCAMCGRTFPPPDAAHIIDEDEWKEKMRNDGQVNGLPLCKTCHVIFEDYLRPRLFAALEAFGSRGLPVSWKESKKRQTET